MQQPRRTFLARAITTTAAVLYGSQAGSGQTGETSQGAPSDVSGLEEQILDLFSDLPERKAIKIWAPATGNGPEVLVRLNASPAHVCSEHNEIGHIMRTVASARLTHG